MTLQQRIKASAQELIRLLEESEKEHQDFIKERDARLGIGDPWEPDGHPLELKVIMGKLDNGKPFTRKAFHKDQYSPQADASEEPSVPSLETKIINHAIEIGCLLEDHLLASMQSRKEKEGSMEYHEKMTSLWNRLLDFDAQIITAAFHDRPQSHLKMLAARLSERY